MTKKYYRYNDEKGQVEWVGEGNFFEPITDELALKADKTEVAALTHKIESLELSFQDLLTRLEELEGEGGV